MDGVQLRQGYRATMRRQLLFTTKFPDIPGTHLIDLGRMKGWINLGSTQSSFSPFSYTGITYATLRKSVNIPLLKDKYWSYHNGSESSGNVQKYQKLFGQIVNILPWCYLLTKVYEIASSYCNILQIFLQMMNLQHGESSILYHFPSKIYIWKFEKQKNYKKIRSSFFGQMIKTDLMISKSHILQK